MSSRAGTAATTVRTSSEVGRSFIECTAASARRSTTASRTRATNTPCPPKEVRAAFDTSPSDVISTSPTSHASSRASCCLTHPVCARASELARVATVNSGTRAPAGVLGERGDGGGVEVEQCVQRRRVPVAAGIHGELLHPHGGRV